MKTIQNCGAQGDVLFRRIDRSAVPQLQAAPVPRLPDGLLVVAHSETGHHHGIMAADAHLIESQSSLIAYLFVDGAYADVVHQRPFDTHETVRLLTGVYEVRRQREHTPEGWRRVAD